MVTSRNLNSNNTTPVALVHELIRFPLVYLYLGRLIQQLQDLTTKNKIIPNKITYL